MICKTLARRLESVTSCIIHPDQTGFIKSRHSLGGLSTWSATLFLIIWKRYCILICRNGIWPSRLEMYFCCHNLGFGSSFVEWIKTLHSSSSASVRTNQISPRFSLRRGTWQGCPHSPSLPVIFIEPLAAYIHANSHPYGTILASYTPNKCSISPLGILMLNMLWKMGHIYHLKTNVESIPINRISANNIECQWEV